MALSLSFQPQKYLFMSAFDLALAMISCLFKGANLVLTMFDIIEDTSEGLPSTGTIENGEHSSQKRLLVRFFDFESIISVVDEFFMIVADILGDCVHLFGGNAA